MQSIDIIPNSVSTCLQGSPNFLSTSYSTESTCLGLTGYPVYHTGFDNFHLMDTILDPGFKITR